MEKLTRDDLYSLEEYAEARPEFRSKVLAHKKDRRVALGPNVTLQFEDRLTMQYQVQEMLRIERLFEKEAVEEELAAYNPLIPDGSNWKATLMVEFEDPQERQRRLCDLIGIEQAVWMQVEGFDRIRPIANEDLDRTTEEKTASVHFLRFELTPDMARAARNGAALAAGVDHEHYSAELDPLPEATRASLVQDLN